MLRLMVMALVGRGVVKEHGHIMEIMDFAIMYIAPIQEVVEGGEEVTDITVITAVTGVAAEEVVVVDEEGEEQE